MQAAHCMFRTWLPSSLALCACIKSSCFCMTHTDRVHFGVDHLLLLLLLMVICVLQMRLVVVLCLVPWCMQWWLHQSATRTHWQNSECIHACAHCSLHVPGIVTSTAYMRSLLQSTCHVVVLPPQQPSIGSTMQGTYVSSVDLMSSCPSQLLHKTANSS